MSEDDAQNIVQSQDKQSGEQMPDATEILSSIEPEHVEKLEKILKGIQSIAELEEVDVQLRELRVLIQQADYPFPLPLRSSDAVLAFLSRVILDWFIHFAEFPFDPQAEVIAFSDAIYAARKLYPKRIDLYWQAVIKDCNAGMSDEDVRIKYDPEYARITAELNNCTDELERLGLEQDKLTQAEKFEDNLRKAEKRLAMYRTSRRRSRSTRRSKYNATKKN